MVSVGYLDQRRKWHSLGYRLDGNLEDLDCMSSVGVGHSAWDWDCLLSHLQAECPEVEAKGFEQAVRETPYEVIDALRLMARRKTLKGTCPVCEEWQ